MNIAVFVYYDPDGIVTDNGLKYIKEVESCFDETIIASNFDYNYGNWIKFPDNWYDWGYLKQAIEVIPDVKCLGFFNNSNYLIGSVKEIIKAGIKSDKNIYGITDTYEGRPDVAEKDQYHIQSHFMIFNNCIKELRSELNSVDFAGINTTDLRKEIIKRCEIGIQINLRKKGFTMGSFFSAKGLTAKYGIPTNSNIHIWLWKQMLDINYPFIKHSIINESFPKHDLKVINNNRLIYPISKAKDLIL